LQSRRKQQKGGKIRLLLPFLLTDPQFLDNSAVAIDVLFGQIVEQIASVPDHFQQAAPAVVILFVYFQMLGQMVDPLGQDRDLNLRRACVPIVETILRNDFLFVRVHDFTSKIK
jgi:hypothetical protein